MPRWNLRPSWRRIVRSRSKFSSQIEEIAKAEVETDQMRQQKDAVKRKNQVLQEHKKLQAMNELRGKHASEGTDDLQTYIANVDALEGLLKKAIADQPKKDELYEAKNAYNKMRNDFLEHFEHYEINTTNPNAIGTQLINTLFNLNLDTASVKDIHKRVDLAQEVAEHAPKSEEWDDYRSWMEDSIEHIQRSGR